MKKKYLHILSFDGLSKVDMAKMRKLPHFSQFYQSASGSTSVITTYPSITYVAHTSVVTGVYPNKHGIINNTQLQPQRKSPDWYWDYNDIQVETLQSVFKKAGLDVLSILWPVTAKSPDIKYNMPEIFANRKWHLQFFVSLMNGSPYFQYKLNSLYGHLRDGHNEPELDDFSHASFLYSLEHFEADVNFVHYIDLDTQRHAFGFDSEQANDALVRLDKRLGEIIARLKELGKYDDSVIVILGDHSSFDCHSTIHINNIFKQHNLLSSDQKGLISSYQAICKSSDGSAYIYADEKVSDEQLLALLNPLKLEGIIADIYSPWQVAQLGADSNCRFMLEASRGYYFDDMVSDNYIMPIKAPHYNKPKRVNVNNHGYNPQITDYETVFLVAGKGIKANLWYDTISIVDEAPTLAAIMGLSMSGDIAGKQLDILEDNL